MAENFDVLDPEHMDGTFRAKILDADGDPNRVLEYNRDWYIKVDWTLTGIDPEGDQDVKALGGEWHVKAVAESCGQGFEGDIANFDLALSGTGAVNPRTYTTTLTIPANKLEPGAYEITVLLTYSNLSTPLRMCAFGEAGIAHIYEFK